MQRCATILLILLLLLPGRGLSGDIRFLTHSTRGKVRIDASGTMRGIPHSGRRAFHVELVREVMGLTGHSPATLSEVPLPRGLRMVRTEPLTAFFNIARTADRESVVKWVGPLQRTAISFYEATAFPTGIRSLGDAGRVEAVCVLNGGNHEAWLQRRGFTNLTSNTSYENCLRMLSKGRVSLVFMPEESFPEALACAKLPPGAVRKTPVSPYAVEGYLAMSRDIPDAVVRRWQEALDHLKASGRYEELARRYLRRR